MGLADPASFRPTPVFRETRRRGLNRVTLVTPGGLARQIMVRDFSTRGFSAAMNSLDLAADDVVTVLLPDGRALWGIVRWADRNVFGVEFDLNASAEAPASGTEIVVRD